MGKPDPSPLAQLDGNDSFLPSQGASASATVAGHISTVVGAGRRRDFLDDDDDGGDNNDEDVLPPLYSDVMEADAAGENAAAISIPRAAAEAEASAPLLVNHDNINDNHNRRQPISAAPDPCQQLPTVSQPWHYCIAPLPDTDSGLTAAFKEAVKVWAGRPPRPFVQLRGTHSETQNNNGKKENVTVVDFNVCVELTPYLFADVTQFTTWNTCHVVENHERAFRGTVFRHRVRGSSSSSDKNARRSVADDIEQGTLHDLPASSNVDAPPTPTLMEWCRRFCEDPSPLRSFTLRRRMTGFDYAKVRSQMESLVRRTNYLGHVEVAFPVNDMGVVCYSDHRFNQWRITRWIQVLCALTLIVIFTWPYLFFRTKKYDIVTIDWAYSRITPRGNKEYVSLSEDRWCRLWDRAITKAVLSKRHATLDQEDLRLAGAPEPTFASTGNDNVDNALVFVSAGINAISQVNWALGWGGDR